MLVTPESNNRNQWQAIAAAALAAAIIVAVGWFFPPFLFLLILCPILYWLLRRRCLRRLAVMKQPFPDPWEQILQSARCVLRRPRRRREARFRQLVQVFLDEVRITGIRTDVDDTVRVLVAASAAIPIFGFHDWEYHRLGEVLVYPASFGDAYQTKGEANENTLGMVGLRHLSGVMIFSKPSLFSGFDNPSSKENVAGVHEFAHLVEEEEAEHGLPPEVSWQAVSKHWVEYVGK